MRPILLLSCQLGSASSVALATAMLAHAPVVQAQSFQGIPTAVFGTVDVNTATGVTNIDVNSDSAVINWLPTVNPAPGQPHISRLPGLPLLSREHRALEPIFQF